MYKKLSLFLSYILILVFLSGCGNRKLITERVEKFNLTETNNTVESHDDVGKLINKEEVINKLTSDKLQGRLVGSLGNELAGEYISDLYKQIGLISMFGENYKHEYSQEVYRNYGLIEEDDYGEVKAINNIVGIIEGMTNNAIIVSAHFDHIGLQDGNIIRGAVDNASGVSVMLDLAEKLNSKYSKEKPEFDIIFCAFNGEEQGLKGSRSFIQDIKGRYDSLININIDSVGYRDGGRITFLDRNTDTSLYEPMKEVIENNGLEIDLDINLKGNADSVAFDKVGIPAICIIEENVKDVIHTEKDTAELIDYERLDKIVKSINEFIEKFIFN